MASKKELLKEQLIQEIEFIKLDINEPTTNMGESLEYYIAEYVLDEFIPSILQEALDYSDKEKHKHLDDYCKQYYALFSAIHEIIGDKKWKY